MNLFVEKKVMVRPRMTLQNLLLHSLAFSFTLVGAYGHNESAPSSCTILPLGTGMDDTQNVRDCTHGLLHLIRYGL